jgi:hypothetical protein
MRCAPTPRIEVLAELTGLGEEPPEPPVVPVGAEVDVELEGVEDPQAAAQMTNIPTTAIAPIEARRLRRPEDTTWPFDSTGSHRLIVMYVVLVAECHRSLGRRPMPESSSVLGYRKEGGGAQRTLALRLAR